MLIHGSMRTNTGTISKKSKAPPKESALVHSVSFLRLSTCAYKDAIEKKGRDRVGP
jgi:hypothetical protein